MSSQKASDKSLRRAEAEAIATLQDFRQAPDPGKGLPVDRAREARDAAIARGREAKAQLDAARTELASRESEKQSWFQRAFAHDAASKRRREGTPTAAEKGMVEFHRDLATAQAERNAEALERKRKAGLLYEPTGTGGGDGAAALFSCATLWDYTEEKLNPDGSGNFVVAQILTGRQVLHLWWAVNLIEEAGGAEARFLKERPPHWPDREGEIPFREADMARLVECKFLGWERGAGGQALVTIRYGTRARTIIDGYRQSVGRARTKNGLLT